MNDLSDGASFFEYQLIFKRQIFLQSLGINLPEPPQMDLSKNHFLKINFNN